ncbi:MAG: hypothetical protein HC782_03220 [Gammaproteobacteria bacterium]|nr:hypothetical protein [Gammaproteobacteria bacterium]
MGIIDEKQFRLKQDFFDSDAVSAPKISVFSIELNLRLANLNSAFRSLAVSSAVVGEGNQPLLSVWL